MISVFNLYFKVIIAYKNKIGDAVNISNISQYGFNSTEKVCYQRFETFIVKMLCVLNTLKLATNNQYLIFNRTTESSHEAGDQ
jgi:hypothetical protein